MVVLTLTALLTLCIHVVTAQADVIETEPAPGVPARRPGPRPTPTPDPIPPVRPDAMPETPSRQDISRALGSRAAAVRACAPRGQSGTLTVRVEFHSSGRVRTADVRSSLPNAAQACVAEAVRKARVPPFRRPIMVVSFPYRY